MAFNIQNRRYTGSKLKITNWIKQIINKECKNCTSFFDVFAGTGIVSASLINTFSEFYINDFLYSNNAIYEAFFGDGYYDEDKINKFFIKYHNIAADSLHPNYVSENFGGKYFSDNDSKKIGYIRANIENEKSNLTKKEYYILLASLLYSFDRCSNTCGHYDAYIKKGQIKDSFTFELINPINTKNKDIHIFREDSNELVSHVSADIAYIDPPYSSRQYSRFYHVLENITEWKKPPLFGTAMKPKEENMSEYCKTKAIDFFNALICNLKVKYIIVSYNNTYNSKSSSSKNKMSFEEIERVLKKRGNLKVFSINHPAFNAGKTSLEDHKEYLFVTEVTK